jgi:hypothetical protein
MLQQYGRIYGGSDLVSVYNGIITGTAISTNFFTWNKPKGVRFVHMLVIGGGGGGGGGAAGALGTARSGGAGGGCGASTRLSMLACLLPDILYVQPGAGGTGGATAANGNAGGASYVTIYPDQTAVNTIAYAGGGGGGNAGGTGASTGGTLGAAATQALMPLGFGTANVSLIAGLAGAAGAAGAVGASITAFTSNPSICTAGAAGGGVDATNPTVVGFAGGAITTGGAWPTLTGGAAGNPPTIGNNGINYGLHLNANSLDILTSRYPLMSTGGCGGGGASAGTVTGARGACGGFGSGGGGGGAANGTSAAGGEGGNGGAGLVIITCTY